MTEYRESDSLPDMERPATPGRGRSPLADSTFDPSTDPARDPELGLALREFYGDPPVPEWEGLRESITGAAAWRLALRRRSAPWWQHAAGWANRAIPFGVAASIALIFWLRLPSTVSPAAPTRLTLDMVMTPVFEEMLDTTLPSSGDDLLRAAILTEDR